MPNFPTYQHRTLVGCASIFHGELAIELALDFAGIFESKWDLYASTLALALADGSLALLKLADPSEPAREALRLKVDDQGLATCVDFTTHSPEHQRRLCVSTSKGMLVEVQVQRATFRCLTFY